MNTKSVMKFLKPNMSPQYTDHYSVLLTSIRKQRRKENLNVISKKDEKKKTAEKY